MARAFLTSVLLLSLIVTTAFCRIKIAEGTVHFKEDPSREVLYLPNGRALKFMSFGYSNALSQLLWFQTISYFGKHYQADQNYEWLGHYCTLVTELNPQLEHPYSFCAQMLAWEAGKVEEANQLLTAAMQYHPDSWYYGYLRGLNYNYFMKDQAKARDDFIHASKLLKAPPFLLRLAAKTIEQLEGPETAIEFLEGEISRTNDPSVKEALLSKLHKLRRGGRTS